MMGLILVVDDEPDAGRLLKRVLAASGHEVVAIGNREQVFKWLQSRSPDLVLLDIKVRGGSGMTVLQHLHEHLPKTKVVVITGHPSVESRSKAQQYGVKEYWTKPIELDELEKRVNELLKLDFLQQSQ